MVAQQVIDAGSRAVQEQPHMEELPLDPAMVEVAKQAGRAAAEQKIQEAAAAEEDRMRAATQMDKERHRYSDSDGQRASSLEQPETEDAEAARLDAAVHEAYEAGRKAALAAKSMDNRLVAALEAIADTGGSSSESSGSSRLKKITTSAVVQKLEGTGKNVELQYVLRFASRNVAMFAAEHRCEGLALAVTAIRQQVKSQEAILNLDVEVLQEAYYPGLHDDYMRALGTWLFTGITSAQQVHILDKDPVAATDGMKLITKLMQLSMASTAGSKENRRALFKNPILAAEATAPPQTQGQLLALVQSLAGEYESLRTCNLGVDEAMAWKSLKEATQAWEDVHQELMAAGTDPTHSRMLEQFERAERLVEDLPTGTMPVYKGAQAAKVAATQKKVPAQQPAQRRQTPGQAQPAPAGAGAASTKDMVRQLRIQQKKTPCNPWTYTGQECTWGDNDCRFMHSPAQQNTRQAPQGWDPSKPNGEGTEARRNYRGAATGQQQQGWQQQRSQQQQPRRSDTSDWRTPVVGGHTLYTPRMPQPLSVAAAAQQISDKAQQQMEQVYKAEMEKVMQQSAQMQLQVEQLQGELQTLMHRKQHRLQVDEQKVEWGEPYVKPLDTHPLMAHIAQNMQQWVANKQKQNELQGTPTSPDYDPMDWIVVAVGSEADPVQQAKIHIGTLGEQQQEIVDRVQLETEDEDGLWGHPFDREDTQSDMDMVGIYRQLEVPGARPPFRNSRLTASEDTQLIPDGYMQPTVGDIKDMQRALYPKETLTAELQCLHNMIGKYREGQQQKYQDPKYWPHLRHTGAVGTPHKTTKKVHWLDDCHLPPRAYKTMQAKSQRRKLRKSRTPDYQQHIKTKKAKEVGAHLEVHGGPKEGAVVDGAASDDMAGSKDIQHVTKVTELANPTVYTTVDGEATATHEGSISYGGITLNHTKLMHTAPESIVTIQTLTDLGYTYVHGKHGAVLVHSDNDKCVELVPVKSGRAILYRLPIGKPGTRLADLEVQHAMIIAAKVQRDREKRMLLEHQKESHLPVCRCGLCWDCLMATAKKPPAKSRGDTPVSGTEHGMVLGLDFTGPHPASSSGNIWHLSAKEAKYGVLVARGLPDKKATTVLKCIQEMVASIRGRIGPDAPMVVRFHSDDDPSMQKEVRAWILSQQALQTDTGGYDCNKNALVERSHQKLIAAARTSMRVATGGSTQYREVWDAAFDHCAEAVSYSPENGDTSPWEKVKVDYPKTQLVDMLKEYHPLFCQVRYPKAKERIVEGKFDDRAGLGLWAGKSRVIPGGCRLLPIQFNKTTGMWDIGAVTDKMVAPTDIDDTVFPLKLKPRHGGDATDYEKFVDQFHPDSMESDVYVVKAVTGRRTVEGQLQYQVQWHGHKKKDWEPAENLLDWGATEAVQDYEDKVKMKMAKLGGVAMATLLQDSDESLKATERLVRQHRLQGSWKEWQNAYDLEFDGCVQPGHTQCLQEIHGLEKEQILKAGKVTRLRMNPEPKKDGRKKMRFLVMGNEQPQEWTVGHTDAPVVSAEGLRLLVFAGDLSDEPEVIASCDAVTAFRQAEKFLPTETPKYVQYRPYKGAPTHVYRLLSSLYGMVDASMRWYKTLLPYLKTQGFVPGENDKCIMINPETKVRVALHVDDTLARGPRHALEKFFTGLRARFEHKEPTYLSVDSAIEFVGVTLTETVDCNGDMWRHMDQQKDIVRFLGDMQVMGSRPIAAPMSSKELMHSDSTPVTEKQHRRYRSAVGSMQYYVTMTQWHLAHPLSRLAQKNSAPTQGDMKQLEQTLAWLSNNSHRKLSAPVLKHTTFKVYSDSDHAGDRLSGTRSHTGVIILCNGAPIQWRSKKQPVTATSSACAEIYALAEAVRDARLTLWKAQELGYTTPIPIEVQVDNAAGISFQQKMNPDSRLKGMIDLRWNWVMELQDTGEVRAVKVHTSANIADILTKCLGRITYEQLIDLVAQEAAAVLQHSKEQ